MDIKIKKFDELSVSELYEVLKIRCEVFILEQNCVYLDIDGSDRDSYHFIGFEKEKICAYLRVPLKGVVYNKTSIGRVLVGQEFRGRGYAKKIINNAIDFITGELGEGEIEISAQLYLKKFYESLGFKVSSDSYLEDGIEHIHMNFSK